MRLSLLTSLTIVTIARLSETCVASWLPAMELASLLRNGSTGAAERVRVGDGKSQN